MNTSEPKPNCEDDHSNKNNQKCVQILLTIFLLLAAASSGMIMGFSAVLLPQLKSTNGSLYTDENMGFWIASISVAAVPAGSALSGLLINCCGPKRTREIQFIVIIIGWIFIMFAKSHAILLFGKFLGGIAIGLGAVAGQVYVAEVSDPRMRGVFGSMGLSSIALGILLVYILGSILHWRTIAGISIIIPALSALMTFYFPESPVYLVRQGYIEKAKKACLWFRGNCDEQAREEIQHLISRAENEKIYTIHTSQSKWKTFWTPHVLKPFLIINIFNLLQVLSGTHLIIFYAVDIVSQINISNMNEFYTTVLTGVIRLISTLTASCLFAFLGRRTIGLCSGVGTFITSCILGTCLYFHDNINSYFLIICLLIYVASNSIGLFILPGIMVGELFPSRARGLAGSITFTIFSIFIFSTAKLFPLLKSFLNIHGIFWMFSVSSFLESILVYLMLPETKGKTLSDIEDYFAQKNVLWITRDKRCYHTFTNNEQNVSNLT